MVFERYVVNVYICTNRLVNHMQEVTIFLVISVMGLYLRTIHYLVITRVHDIASNTVLAV